MLPTMRVQGFIYYVIQEEICLYFAGIKTAGVPWTPMRA
jgi:hypothetical protein